jgi:glycosyltransferase involved in cell wall biosynthesis
MDDLPEVSVIMPNHNNGRFVETAIRSVLDQTFSDLELVFVDDASTDDSHAVAKGLSEKDSRVRVLQTTKRVGSAGARNQGIADSRGRVVCFLDSDDVYAPSKVTDQLEVLDAAPEPVVVYCDWWRLDESGANLGPSRWKHPTKDGRIFSEALVQAYGGVAMCMMPRACIDRVGLFDESLVWAEDLDLVLKLAREFEFRYISKALYGYRSHESSKREVVAKRERMAWEALVIERHFKSEIGQLDTETKDRVVANLMRLYSMTGQRRKLMWYGMSSLKNLGRMLNLTAGR